MDATRRGGDAGTEGCCPAAGTNKRRWMCDALSQERSAHNTHDTTVRWMRHGGGRVARTLACGRESGICFRCLCGICCGCTGPVTTLRRARFESRDACDVSVCCGCAHYENKKTRPCLSSAITHASQFDALQHPPLALRALSIHHRITHTRRLVPAVSARATRSRALRGIALPPWEHIRRTAAHSAQI